MKKMLIDEAYKVLVNAKAGNGVSATVYNDWAEKNKLPLLPDPEYDKVNTYEDFYNLTYYYWFGD